MNEIKLILQALDIIVEEKLWPDRKPSEIFNILLYVHNKGWLYTPTIDGNIIAVMCGYRIPSIDGDNLVKLPIKEEGNILYIPFVLSMKKEDNIFNTIRESMKIYLAQNPNIEEIVLEDKNKKIKHYNLKTLQGV